MRSKLIVIDGRSYQSVDEMPEDVRKQYEQAMQAFKDENNNKVADAFENMNLPGDKDQDGVADVFKGISSTNVMTGGMKIIVNGQEFHGVEDLPPEVRAKYEQAMGSLDKNKNGMPDFLEGMMNMPDQPANATPASGYGSGAPNQPFFGTAQNKPMTASTTITPDTSNGWMLALAGLLLLGLCVAGAAVVWYYFLR
jgi:hypothetical protein